MKNPLYKKNYIGYALLYVLVITASVIFRLQAVIIVGGVATMILAFVCIEEWTVNRILIILSPVVTFPLYFMLMGGLLSAGLIFFLVVYALIYAFLLKDFWSWVGVKAKKYVLLSIITMGLMLSVYGYFAISCFYSAPEIDARAYMKDSEIEYINKCRAFNFSVPKYYDSGSKFNGVPRILISSSTYLPSFIIAFTVINFFIPRKRKGFPEP